MKDKLSHRIIQAAATSRRFLDRDSRCRIIDFILEKQNPDGGFRGRSQESDLYYTMFAVASLRALGNPIPATSIWKYTRTFGDGKELSLVHLFCLIRLKTFFPMLPKTRKNLQKRLYEQEADSEYNLFLKLLGEELLTKPQFPDEQITVRAQSPSTNLAAAILVNTPPDDTCIALLLNRFSSSGGCQPTDLPGKPDLLSTGTALLALITAKTDLFDIHKPCFSYIESLWSDNGGFRGHVNDQFEDVEYTFYALLSIGCLILSMEEDYLK